jgi:hypothetical protein
MNAPVKETPEQFSPVKTRSAAKQTLSHKYATRSNSPAARVVMESLPKKKVSFVHACRQDENVD